MREVTYNYKNLQIPGGGYVTGFLFHPTEKNILYIRTDIGGSYQYDYAANRWHSLTESVTMADLRETFPIALCVDAKKPGRLLIASGINQEDKKGKLSVSEDYGQSFYHLEMPCFAHGNLNGRGTGERMIMDPAKEEGIYFASQREGLWYSPDLGRTWERRKTGEEAYMTFVWASPSGKTVVAGTAGVNTGTNMMRGHSLYVSYDFGQNFTKLMMPESIRIEGSKWSGYVAHRYDYDGTYLYITLVNTGDRAYVTEMGYSCDCGNVLGGRILRYSFDETEVITGYCDITPVCFWNKEGAYEVDKDSIYGFGFGGIGSCRTKPGLLAASTLCRDEGDMLFVSFDYGEHWEAALYDLSVGNLQFETPYMKPCYNGGESLIHWLSDVKFNPFDADEVWFNSGTGVFKSKKFTSSERSFMDCCKGIEETVHLNVYGMPAGPVQALDIVGDLGGFAFKDLSKPCENSFADKDGNRYITSINADFSDMIPQTVVVTPRGNWKGKTKGGLIISQDYGQSFDRIPLPFGISDYLDERFRQIECPNVNSGWVALNSTADTIVYGVAEGIDLYMKGIIVSNDLGKNFHKSVIIDENGSDISYSDIHMKIFSDRTNPDVFYGFTDGFGMYISTDRGNCFHPLKVTGIPRNTIVFGLIDCANKTEIRGEAGKEGIFYIAAYEYGLWKLSVDIAKKCVCAVRLTKDGERVFAMGLGVLRENGDYLRENKAVYICGEIEGGYGFFRSQDDGKSWVKMNNETQHFGDINSIDGDCRCFGRFYIATGSFGLKYGEIAEETACSIS